MNHIRVTVDHFHNARHQHNPSTIIFIFRKKKREIFGLTDRKGGGHVLGVTPSPFEGKSISFWVRYGLEGNRSPQNGDICGSRDEIKSRIEDIAQWANLVGTGS